MSDQLSGMGSSGVDPVDGTRETQASLTREISRAAFSAAPTGTRIGVHRVDDRIWVLVVPPAPSHVQFPRTLDEFVVNDSLLELITVAVDRVERPGRTQITVGLPTYANVDIRATVAAVEGISSARLRHQLFRFVDPQLGGVDSDGWGFGKELTKEDVADFLRSISPLASVLDVGLRWANPLRADEFDDVDAVDVGLGNLLLAAGVQVATTDGDVSSDSDDGERSAVETLAGEAATRTRTALEQPAAELGRFLDEPSVELWPDDELFLRAQLDTIQIQLRSGEPDRFMVERAIALIVQRLAKVGRVGEGARVILEQLGAEPPEIVDTVVETLQEIVEEVSTTWGQPSVPDAAVPIEAVGHMSDEVVRLLAVIESRIPATPSGTWKIAKTAGSAAGATAGAAKLLELSVTYRVDQILLRFAEAISRFWEYWAPFV